MDYGAAAAEDAAGGSPWATSPHHSKTTFADAERSGVPSTPTRQQSYDPSFPPSAAGESPYQAEPAARAFGAENGDRRQDENEPSFQSDEYAHQDVSQAQQPAQRQQQHPPRQAGQRYHGQQQRRPQAHYKLQAKVTALERSGKKDPIFKFDVYTNLPKFRTTQFRDVRRTHGEFVKLAEHLISANPEAMVPAVPPAVTAAGAGTEEDEIKVKNNIQRWLNVVSTNEVLIRDEEIIFFVESDFGYSPVVRRKQPATGVRRKMIKQFAPPPDDTQELADARPVVKLFYLGTMDAGQKVDKVVKARRALGLSESQLGITFSQLAPQENHPGLALAYRKLGATIRAVGDFHLQQGTFEASTLSDTLHYHSSDAFIVKETLTNRQILMRELFQAQSNTKSKLGSADRLRSSSTPRSDKVDEAIASLEDAKKTEEGLQKKVTDVTRNLVGEQRKWFDRTAKEIRISLKEYVIRQIEAERRTLATLETVRPDIRNIDSSGGLSRLGRESHPKVRRSSLASSQGPRGDAWSGVQRRPDGVRRVESGGLAGIPVPEEDDLDEEIAKKKAAAKGTLKGMVEDDDEDRVDARNAASRLAQTTF